MLNVKLARLSVKSFNVSLSESFIRKMKLALSNALKLSTIPVLPIMSSKMKQVKYLINLSTGKYTFSQAELSSERGEKGVLADSKQPRAPLS